VSPLPRFRLKAARVFVSDFERAYAFYWRTLGLEVVVLSSDTRFALFDTGPTQLIVEAVDPAAPEERALVGRFLGFALAVPDLDAVHRELEAKGVKFLVTPRPQPWAGRLAHLLDPDGNILTLVE
jgi:catechol 2,3-dioxygenase-like lactoylglutathione lyase family enzyme